MVTSELKEGNFPVIIYNKITYRIPTGGIDHDTCTDNFLYRSKHQVLDNGTIEKHPKKSPNILIIS